MKRFEKTDNPPPRKKRTSADRFAWHACWHGDAWLGVMDLSGLATGIYWKIILRMYIKRGALTDHDADMARMCNETLKNYRRAKAELIAAGRIVVDTENGILFDERAIRELVDGDRFSEAQTERAKNRWREKKQPKQPTLRVVENVTPITPEAVASLREVGIEVGANSDTKSAPTSLLTPDSAQESGCRSDAIHTHTQIQPSNVQRSTSPRRPPLNRGGAPAEDVEARKAAIAKAAEELRARLGVMGKDGGEGEATPAPRTVSKAADRTVKRT